MVGSAKGETPHKGRDMATTNVVNLDALIPREDMGVASETLGSKLNAIDILHLEDHFFARSLRKPDFQRETVHWSPDKVLDLIRAFIDADLVPAVILWQRGANVFVIDGAHRLSALMAWVNDDYGDGAISIDYFGYIPDEQRRIAERTRKVVNEKIGAYLEYRAARKNLDAVRPERRVRAGIDLAKCGNAELRYFVADILSVFLAFSRQPQCFVVAEVAIHGIIQAFEACSPNVAADQCIKFFVKLVGSLKRSVSVNDRGTT